MRLKLVGFFKELEHGNERCGNLKEIVNKIGSNLQYKDKVLNYLNNGVESAVAPMTIYDVFNPEKSIGTLVTYTDGLWEWPADYPYYIENYNIQIPEEFILHMLNNNWVVNSKVDFESLEPGEYVSS